MLFVNNYAERCIFTNHVSSAILMLHALVSLIILFRFFYSFILFWRVMWKHLSRIHTRTDEKNFNVRIQRRCSPGIFTFVMRHFKFSLFF